MNPSRPRRLERLESRIPLAADVAQAGPLLACHADPSAAAFATPAESAAAVGLKMTVRDSYLPGTPLLVRLELQDAEGQTDRNRWDATAHLTTDNPQVQLSQTQIHLVNGMGSILVDVQGEGPFQLTARVDELAAQKQIQQIQNPTVTTFSGRLSGDTTLFEGVVHITDDLIVPRGHQLTIAPGTLVLVNGAPQTSRLQLGAQIVVEGALNANGTDEQPITITAAQSDQPWGELDVAGGTVLLNHTHLTRAGSSPRGGHTNTGPALRLRGDGQLTLNQSSVTDVGGKILQSTSGDLIVRNSLLARAVMGPEIEATSLSFEDSWIIEMAGVYHHNGTVDDNDGIYLHQQSPGQTIEMRRSVVAQVQDDGIDTLGSTVRFDDVIVRDITDKAMSLFNGEVTVHRALLVNADIGIETKGSGSSTADVTVDRSTIARVNHGIRAFDKDSPDPNVLITYNIRNSIIHVRPGGDPLLTDYDPTDMRVNYVWSEEAWPHAGSGEGIVSGGPLFLDVTANDFRLAPGSVAIDAGDPAADLDPDGSPADLGYFTFQPARPSGDLNDDGAVDAGDIDLLCDAIGAASNHARFDLNQDGSIDNSDYEFMVKDLLQTQLGDANLDGIFDSNDLVLVLESGGYEDRIVGNSGWAGGDWNCDGDFTSDDLVVALQSGGYVAAAVR